MKALALGLLAVAAGVAAAAPHYRPYMTGDQLVRDMLADPTEGRNSIRRERAMGYMDGVMDATVDTAWCPGGKIVPHELNYVVIEDIARLSPARLKGDAAPLIADSLRRRFPCTARVRP